MSSPKPPNPFALIVTIPLGAGAGFIAGGVTALLVTIVAMFTPGPTPWQGTAMAWGMILCVIAGACIPVFMFFSAQSDHDEHERKAAQAEKARKQSQRDDRIANQKHIKSQLDRMNQQALTSVKSLNTSLIQADRSLDAAEREYKANVYSYFWREIEHAVKHLGAYKTTIDSIKVSAQNHKNLAAQYEGAAPSFAATSSTLSGVKEVDVTLHRMDVVVRQALRQSDFAFIYEQRRTSSILVAGFANLGQALDQMSSSIASSISGLSSSIEGVGRELKSEMSQNALFASMDAKRALNQHKEYSEKALSEFYKYKPPTL